MWNLLEVQVENTNLPVILFGIFGSIITNFALRQFYIRYGKSNTNRVDLANNFVLLGISITLIIFLIKASLALSLGLVGALSIVRFRAAIKDPEELVFLFFSIAIGLGFGAEQGLTTIVVFLIAMPVYYFVLVFLGGRKDSNSLFLHFSCNTDNQKISIQNIIAILNETCKSARIVRLDENTATLDATFSVFFANQDSLIKAKQSLLALEKSAEVSMVDSFSPAV